MFNPKSTRGCPPLGFWLIPSEVDGLFTRNFVTFLKLNAELGQSEKFSKVAIWVTLHDHIW